MELHLGWDKVLVSQQLQLPHPTSLHQLEGDVLRVGALSAEQGTCFFKELKIYDCVDCVDLRNKKCFIIEP